MGQVRAAVTFRWQDLLSAEDFARALSEAEFDGEDVLRPVVRGAIDAYRRRIECMRDWTLEHGEKLELAEPAGENRKFWYENCGWQPAAAATSQPKPRWLPPAQEAAVEAARAKYIAAFEDTREALEGVPPLR